MKPAPLAAAVLAAAALLVSGCSSGTDVASVLTTVQDGLNQQLGGEWTVQCPDSMSIEAGLTTDCLATSATGDSVQVAITQNDDQGNVTWETTPPQQ